MQTDHCQTTDLLQSLLRLAHAPQGSSDLGRLNRDLQVAPSIRRGQTLVDRAASLRRILLSMIVLSSTGFADDNISFSRQIQPIFAEHCLQCHGPDTEKREAELRLDVESSAKKTVIDADTPDDCELILRVTSGDLDTKMPPGDAPSLSSAEIDLIRRWIAQGAKYERHWAFRPVKQVTIPDVVSAGEPLSDIDRLVIAKLRENDLELSTPASKWQLIRRATFDLTGLPPSWNEVQEFIDDHSPVAFSKVVDRLLESPAYGERWGRHWLDIARYADTHGGAAIGFTEFPFSYTYRDYVIDAFRKDVPYNQFVIEQLAADQLGLSKDAAELAALGFLTVGRQFRNRHNVIDDQIDVVTRGLMGLTVACARCHDHKFDPITTADYYSLYATLASSDEPEELPRIGATESTPERREYLAQLERLKTSYTEMVREQSEVMRGRLRMQVGLYLREIAKDMPEPDLVSADVFSYRTDDLRPNVLHNWQKYLRDMPEDDAVFGPWLKLSKLSVDGFGESAQQIIESLSNENGDRTQDLHKLSSRAPKWNPRVLAGLTAKRPQTMLDVADVYGELFARVHREWLSALLETSLEARPGLAPVPDESREHLVVNSPVNRQLRRHLYGPDSPTNVADRLAGRLLNRPINDNVSGRRAAIHSLNLASPGSPPRAMVLNESSEDLPFFVFERGNPLRRGEPVLARFPSVLGGNKEKRFPLGSRRLNLALSIVDPANPLTRRVIVNWVWQHHFGKGLVRTPDDFGTRGTPPTHPGLLDYLATKLLDDHWSLKQLHRRIMLTRVYQQASRERTSARVTDPHNARLWRMPRKRLGFEAMRDAMLVASGELRCESGGRPFRLLSKPIVPKRSVYAFVNRDIINPLMSTFDTADPNACTAKRPETTVPQQTLFALNSDFIQDRAEAMVNSVLLATDESASDEDIIRSLYRRAFSREPSQKELKTVLTFVKSLRTNNDELVSWQRLTHTLLASNEFVFLD